MPFEIVRNDIVNMQVDAIVNTANPEPVIGQGTDSAIHAKAGPELLQARQAIGRIGVGCAALTPAFGLNARYVIHTVGPRWRGGLLGETRQLKKCYLTSLELALEQGCGSIAFPLICAGSYGFPKDKALQVAVAAFSEFLTEHDMHIYLVVFHKEAFRLSENLVRRVRSFVDEHYVQEKYIEEYGPVEQQRQTRLLRQQELQAFEEEFRAGMPDAAPLPMMAPQATHPVGSKKRDACASVSLDDLLARTDAGFSETLLRLIDQSGKKDSQIYTRANISRQHFSKIRNNPAYKPTKTTALALAIALELDLEKTADLIGRAGFVLTNSSKFDVIVRYFIENRNYDMMQINTTLFEFDQALLGA